MGLSGRSPYARFKRSKIHFQHWPYFSSLLSYDGTRYDITIVQMNFKGRSVAQDRLKCATLFLNSVETLANVLSFGSAIDQEIRELSREYNCS